MTPIPKPARGGRKREQAKRKRAERLAVASSRQLVFSEDQRCRFPHSATFNHPCFGPDELMHMGDHARAKTVGMDPEDRHDVRWLMRACREHHQGTYSYDGSLGGRGFNVEPLDAQLLYRGPCRFIDVTSGALLGIN